MNDAIQKLGDAIVYALDEAPAGDVIGLLAGALCTITETLAVNRHADPNVEITLEGPPGQRRITLHAKS